MGQPGTARAGNQALRPSPLPLSCRSITLWRVPSNARPQTRRRGTSIPRQAGTTMRVPGGRQIRTKGWVRTRKEDWRGRGIRYALISFRFPLPPSIILLRRSASYVLQRSDLFTFSDVLSVLIHRTVYLRAHWASRSVRANRQGRVWRNCASRDSDCNCR